MVRLIILYYIIQNYVNNKHPHYTKFCKNKSTCNSKLRKYFLESISKSVCLRSSTLLLYTHDITLLVETVEEGGNEGGEEAPGGNNMVLRKRIKRIRAGMKKYNTQLDEVKRSVSTRGM